jgi:hypothetical protein
MRLASAFFHSQQENDCDRFTEDNGKGFFNLEILKLLIIHGYMEPVASGMHQSRSGNQFLGASGSVSLHGKFK